MKHNPGQNWVSNQIARDALILFLMAFLVRMLFFSCFRDLLPGGDEKDYWEFALTAASGHIPERTYHPPLWGYLLAPFAFISKQPVAGRLFVVFIGSVSVSMMYLLGNEMFDRKTGWVAGFLYAFCPNMIGFSHYLWAESMLAFMVLLSAVLFWRDQKTISGIGNGSPGIVYMVFVIVGLALLVKEFAAILFGSLVVSLLLYDFQNKKRIIAVSTMIFLMPVVIYSIWASISSGRTVILADAFIYNSNQVEHDFETFTWSHEKNKDLFINALIHEKLMKIPEAFPRQVGALWGPNSYPYFRLRSAPDMFGKYHTPYARGMSYVIIFAYLFVVISGITGLCFSEYSPFKLFCLLNIVFLSSLGLIFLLCSRFRIPYMFVFILYSAVFYAHPRKVFLQFKDPGRIFSWVFFMALFICLTLLKWKDLGAWG